MLWIFVAMIVLGALGVLVAHRLNPVLIKMSNGEWKALLLFSIGATLIGTSGLIVLLIRVLESAK